jgi:hypothetical protein
MRFFFREGRGKFIEGVCPGKFNADFLSWGQNPDRKNLVGANYGAKGDYV